MSKNQQWRGKKNQQDKKEKSPFKEELIDIARVTRVVKWWRRMRFRATVVVWDENWKVWLWTWKAWEVATAIQKAVTAAKKNMISFTIVNWTIAREVDLKYKSARILIMPACEWTWIIAWWSIRKIAEVCWIHNLLSKRFGTTNKLVNAQAMMNAIQALSEMNVRKPKQKEEEKAGKKEKSEAVKAETDKPKKTAKKEKTKK